MEQEVEWRYAFDIHCNAFLPFFLLASVLHYFLLPFLLAPSLPALIVSNALYALALALYFYITHLGYRGKRLRDGPHPTDRLPTHASTPTQPTAPPNTTKTTALPFLHKTEVFLYPSGLALVLFVLLLLVGLLGEPYRFSATLLMDRLYFRP